MGRRGRLLVPVHVDPVVVEPSGWHTHRIRTKSARDGGATLVLVVRAGYRQLGEEPVQPEELLEEARRVRANVPDKLT